MTVDPFYSPETFPSTKPEFKKSSKKTKDEDSDTKKTDEDAFISKIQKVDLSEYRVNDLDLYRQIIQDALSLCEEEIVCPYISKEFGIHDVNKAVEFIKNKECTGKVLIDLSIDPADADKEKDEKDKDDKDSGSDSEEKDKK